MSGIKAAGLVAAAGMSARMGAFKPLLELDGKPLLCRTVESLLQGGAEQVVVVTGRNHRQITEALDFDSNVQVIHNAAYETTTMLDSVKLGLQQLRQFAAVLVLPGDVPAIRPQTIKLLLEAWEKNRPDVLYPVYPDGNGREEQWHPPVISGALMPELLNYHGPQGLKGGLSQLAKRQERLLVPDVGCTMDADYAADYERLCAYWPRRYYPNLQQCQVFYQLVHTPQPVQQHCVAVAQKALQLGEALQQKGLSIQLNLLESAALLHDVCRTETNHAQAGAAFLQHYGLKEVAALVAGHMDWPPQRSVLLDELGVLYLADKLVSGNQHISLRQRFAAKAERYVGQPEILQKIQLRQQTAERLMQLLQQQGISAEQLI